MKQEIKVFKLINGTDVIGIKIFHNENTLTLKNPVLASIRENKIYFYLYMDMSFDEDITFNMNHIMNECSVTEEIRTAYLDYCSNLDEMKSDYESNSSINDNEDPTDYNELDPDLLNRIDMSDWNKN